MICEPCELPPIVEVKNIVTVKDKKEALVKVLFAASQFFKVHVLDLTGKTREAEIVLARQMAMCYLYERFSGYPIKLSLKDIGGNFGGRDHTTVIHSKNTIADRCFTDPDIKNEKQAFFAFCDVTLSKAA